jgi:hypothetical protein
VLSRFAVWQRLPANLRFAAALCSIHFAVLLYLFRFHELWRDEVRALNIARDSRSPLELIANLHNEGHPILWYAILYIGYTLFRTPVVLVAASFLIAEAAVFLFAAYAPFARWQRVLFAFGVFPLYEYAIMCRNYGLGMLLGFIFCILYPRRFERPLAMGAVIALFANATALCAVIGAGLTALWLLESAWRLYRGPNEGRPRAALRAASGIAIAVAGIGFSVWVFRADAHSLFYHPRNLIFANAYRLGLEHLARPGARLTDMLGLSGSLATAIGVWLLTLYLLVRHPFVGVFFYGSIAAFDLFSGLIYEPQLRHKGLAYVVLLMALWLDARLPERALIGHAYRRFCQSIGAIVAGAIPMLFAVQVSAAYDAIRYDQSKRLSGSKWLGQVLEEQPELNRAILIGEPEVRIEAVSYYVDNPVYQMHDNRFAFKVSFDKNPTTEITLDDMLTKARKLHASFHRPVVMVIGPKLSPTGPFSSRHLFERVFRYDQTMLARFREATRHIATIRDNIAPIVDPEEFDIYVLR